MDISSAVGVAGGIVVGVLASANCLAPAPAAPAAPPSVAAEYSYSCDAFDGAPPADTRDAKVVHFIRHAQGQHNLAVATEGEQAYTNWTWRDSRLTPTGIEQSAAAAPVTDKMKFDVVLCSPLSRTLQTAVQAVPSMHGKIVTTHASPTATQFPGDSPDRLLILCFVPRWPTSSAASVSV